MKERGGKENREDGEWKSKMIFPLFSDSTTGCFKVPVPLDTLIVLLDTFYESLINFTVEKSFQRA